VGEGEAMRGFRSGAYNSLSRSVKEGEGEGEASGGEGAQSIIPSCFLLALRITMARY